MPVNDKTKMMIDGWIRSSANEVISNARGVETKMIGVMAGGSVVIGIAPAGTLPASMSTPIFSLALVPLAIAAVAYVIILGSTLKCLLPQEFRVPNAPPLLRKYEDRSPDVVLRWHSKYVDDAYTHNVQLLDAKVKMLRCGLVALAIETGAMFTWAVFRVFSL